MPTCAIKSTRSPATLCLLLIANLWAAVAALSCPALAQAATAQEAISYTIRKGDTLFSLNRQYFIRANDWKRVQKINRVADPRRLTINRQLRIPISMLKYRAAGATVAAFRGQATAAQGNASLRSLVVGQVLGEGARMATGPASSLSLSLSDGSVITLPSNSALRITRLRKLVITDSIDYDLALESGSVRSRVTPFRNAADRFRLRNPIAVSAVRGTDFRTRYDAQQNLAYAELIEGGLAVSRPGNQQEAQLGPNYGAVIGTAGGITTEQLLGAPALVSGGGVQRAESLAFAIEPVPGAQGYRLQIARDSGFIDVVADEPGNETAFTLPALANGNYFARFTAFAASGLEGMPGTFAFRRRLNTTALAAASGDDGYTFRWIGTGEGLRRYRFQLRAEGSPLPLVDEAQLGSSSIILSDLAPGRYAWRVGTTLFADGDADTAWTEFESFVVDE